nr:MAG: replication associated protein [Cressdnaviricota sp.]
MTTLATQWSMVINNPTETDYALVTRGYPDYVREMVWTREIGENGTEHIQAYVKLQRQQRMSFIKKLFPRGHFKAITRDEYSLNTKEYAQKDDPTTAGAHRQVYNEPIPAADTLLYRLVEEALKTGTGKYYSKLWDENTSTLDHPDKPNSPFNLDKEDWIRFTETLKLVEHATVRLQPRIEKILVSAQYKSIKKEWLRDIAMRIITTQYEHGINEAEARIEVPILEEADSDIDGEESDEDSEDGGSEPSEGSGTDEDLSSATDSSAD